MIHFLLDNGIGQNITASIFLAIPSGIWAFIQHRRIGEIHKFIQGSPDFPRNTL